MGETMVPSSLDLLQCDDDTDYDEAGTFGLHLGVLRRLARFAREASAPAGNETETAR